MRVLFHYEVGKQLNQQLRAMSGEGIDLIYCAQSDEETFAREIRTADVLWHVLKPVHESHIISATRLKLIQKIGVGVNTIDLDAARAANVAVCNMPGTNSRAVAEMTLMLMLAGLRLQPRLDGLCRSGQWHPDQATSESFREINGKTVGLVGFGSIPQILAPILKAMGASILYTSRRRKDVAFEYASMDEMLKRADIVSLHVPLTSETKHMINAEGLSQMKSDAVLINTARGELVDENALYDALVSGRLHAAGLDVFSEEPVPASNPLLTLDNVIPAPHVGWLTQETWQRSLRVALENTDAIRSGAQLRYRVV